MVNISKFVKTTFLFAFAGLAFIGYLGYHAVRWIINKCQRTEKVDQVAQKNISLSSEKISHSSKPSTLPHVSTPKSKDSNLSGSKNRVDETVLKQEFERQKAFAATKIQNACRGRIARLALEQLKIEKLEKQKIEEEKKIVQEQKIAAAIKIQSILRGHSAQIQATEARKHLLSYALLEKAKPYIDIPSNLKNLPEAPSGKTRVYLPKELPIVLKQSGSPENQKRFDKMKQGRDICIQRGYENLVIPKARVYGNFIVESRVPITVHGTKEQIGLYIENRERFTAAVKEFTGFRCQAYLSDIIGGSNDPYGTLSETPVGRYDNVALYIEDDQGKIGLIDLERFEPNRNQLQKRCCYDECLDAVRLFPYHLDEILDSAKNFDPEIQNDRKKLEEERDGALRRFKLAYEDHLEFIKEKGISLENPLKMVEINFERKNSIKEAMVSIIRKEHTDFWFKNCLGENPEETIALFEKSFPKILDLTTAFLLKTLERKVGGTKEAISSYGQLLSCRTFRFQIPFKLQQEVESGITMLKGENDGFAQLIIESIFKELAKGQEIAYYNPRFGYGGHAKQCIFC